VLVFLPFFKAGKELKARFNGSGDRIDTGNFLPEVNETLHLKQILDFNQLSISA